jgi:hypothetical protein
VSSSQQVPVVLFQSRDRFSVFRNETLSLFGDAFVANCDQDSQKNRANLIFDWSLFVSSSSGGLVLQSSREMQSVSVNPREFRLPPYRMSVGLLYTVKLSAKHSKSMKTSSSSVQILVRAGDLICQSLGGGEFGLRLDGSLLLDLSKSYDSNVDPKSTALAKTDLWFDWSCFRTSPSYQPDCKSLIFSRLPLSPSQFVVSVNSTVRTAIHDVFVVEMRGMTSASSSPSSTGSDRRSCQKTIRLSILGSLSPSMRLDVISGSKMNPSSKLKILASVDLPSSGELSWSINDASTQLSAVALSPISRTLPASPPGFPHSVSLVVAGNSFREQSSLTFTLTCSVLTGRFFRSTVVVMNSPPFGGTLEVRPQVGVMLETQFTMRSLDWSDDDLPLSSVFGYLPTLSLGTGLVVLRSKIELSHTSSVLPSGQDQSSNISCVVMVFDRLGSSSQSSVSVQVKETAMGVGDLQRYFLAKVNMSQLADSSDDLKNALSTVSSVLNRVNCSSAPDCVSLNRLPCFAIEGTCGECAGGYVGMSGSSNTRCISLRKDIRRLIVESSTSSTDLGCSSDADCEAGLFLECNQRSNRCEPIQQSCPNSCSGHGRCVFVSRYDASVSVSECGVLDVSCVACCECEEAYVGSSSCSLRAEEVSQAMAIRGLLVESVGELMSMENADASSVRSWMRTLSLIGSDWSSLSVSSKRAMASLTVDILRLSREVGLSMEDQAESGLVKVLDLCVSGLAPSSTSSFLVSSVSPANNSSTLDAGSADLSLLVSLLREYSEFVTSDMLEAQDLQSSVSPYLRSSSFSLSSSSSLLLSIPDTNLESLLKRSGLGTGLSQQSVELSPALLFPLEISVSETLTQPTTTKAFAPIQQNGSLVNESVTESQLSLPLYVTLGSSPCRVDVSGSVDCYLRATMQHTDALDSTSPVFSFLSSPQWHNDISSAASGWTSSSPSSSRSNSNSNSNSNRTFFETDCEAGVVEDRSFECPLGDVVTISCNGSSSPLRGRRYCPMRSTTVECQARVHSSASSSSGSSRETISCQLSDLNESMSVCMCNLSEVEAIGDAGSVTFSILSIGRSVVSDFASTWESVPALSSGDVSRSWVVLTTVGGLAGAFLSLILLGMHFDSFEKRSLSVVSPEEIRRSGGLLFAGISPSDPCVGQPPAESAGRSTINEDLQLIEECLPSVFQCTSLWTKVKEEMRVYHRWLGIVFHYSPEFPRSMRVLSLFSSIVIMLFVQSVTYNIADPDDGSCEACKDESQCFSLRSTLNVGQSRCYWEPVSESGTGSGGGSGSESGSCHFREIGEDMTRMFIVALLSAIVSAPFALSVQYVIATVLSRETIDEAEAEKERREMQARRTELALFQRQRSVAVAPGLVESCEGSSADDYNNLQRELSEHYTQLLEKKDGAAEAEEFRGE